MGALCGLDSGSDRGGTVKGYLQTVYQETPARFKGYLTLEGGKGSFENIIYGVEQCGKGGFERRVYKGGAYTGCSILFHCGKDLQRTSGDGTAVVFAPSK